MTTEIEKQFFDTFGIEPKPINVDVLIGCRCKDYNCFVCTSYNKPYCFQQKRYPTITAEKLLELICVLAKFTRMESGLSVNLSSFAVYELKDELINKGLFLFKLIQNTDRKANFKQAVRKLFEEGIC